MTRHRAGDAEVDGSDSVADLLAHRGVIDPLERAQVFDEVTRGLFSKETIPRRIGRYRLGERLGGGGQGVVYAADDPELMRRVAIKVLRIRGDIHAGARLRREAQALAQLAHPNVIEINDVGVCPAGVYIVMQYVPGCTLSEWLGTNRSWRDVVRVLAAAGRGLEAAHRRGIVHRDFKPSNVWMGDDGVVRLLDFGLAELGEGSGTWPSSSSHTSGHTPRTGEALVAGTPAYMAPEQHAGRPATEASDQYSYCVTLYEALFGRRPFAAASLEALAAAKNVEAITPTPEGARVPSALLRIVKRGLRPVTSERWPSMTALVDAIDRCARPRRPAAVGMFAAASLAAAIGLATWAARGMERSRRAASCSAEADRMDAVWNPARERAIATALEETGVSYAGETWSLARDRVQTFAEAWKDTRKSTCEAAEIDQTLVASMAAASRACLDEERLSLDALLAQFSEPDPAMVQTVATATASLPLLRECTEEASLRRRIARPDDPEARERTQALRARLTEAAAATQAGRHARALELAERVRSEARAEARQVLVAEANVLVGVASLRLGRYEESREALEMAFFDARATGDDVLALRAASWLVGVVGNRLARHEDGLQWSREATGLIARLNLSDDLAAAGVLAESAATEFVVADYDEARQLTERALAIKEAILGREHPEVANALNTLGSIRVRQGDHDEALGLHERALAIQQDTLGLSHPDVGITLSNIATIHYARADYDEALLAFERSLDVWSEALGPRHPNVATALNNVALVQLVLGEPRKAVQNGERALAIQEGNLQPDHPHVGAVVMNLGNAHTALGEYDRALALYGRALAINEKALGPEHPEVARTLDNLGAAHSHLGETHRAIELHERALVIWEKVHGPDNHEAARSINNLGFAHRDLGEYDRAEELHRRALAIWEKIHGPDHAEVGRSLIALGDVAIAREAFDTALALYERALTIDESTTAEAGQLAAARFGVAQALWETGGDRSRALALAGLAEEAYEAMPRNGQNELAEVRAWLKSHRASTAAR